MFNPDVAAVVPEVIEVKIFDLVAKFCEVRRRRATAAAYLDDARPFKPIAGLASGRLRYVTRENLIVVIVTNGPASIAQIQDRFADIG